MRVTSFAVISAIFAFTITAVIPAQLATYHAIASSESISKKWQIFPGSMTSTMQVTINSNLLPGNTLVLKFIWSWANRGFTIDDWPLEIDLGQSQEGYVEGVGTGQALVPNSQNILIGLSNFYILVEFDPKSGQLLDVLQQDGNDEGIDVIEYGTPYLTIPVIQIIS